MPATNRAIGQIRELYPRALAAHFAFEVRKLVLEESDLKLRRTLSYLEVMNEPPVPVSLRVHRDD